MTSSTTSPPAGYEAATPRATLVARSMPMLPVPRAPATPIMPPGRANEEPDSPIAVAVAATSRAAATAASPPINRLRWRISLPLQRPAGVLELLLADLAAGEPPAQGVHRLVAAALRPHDGARHEDDQGRDAAPEEDHHAQQQEPAPAVVVAVPYHFPFTS